MKQADIDKNAKTIDVAINQTHVADFDALAKLLGQVRTSSEFRMPGSWIAFCVVQEGSGAHVYWCIAGEHDYAQAAMIKAAQQGHLGEVGRFEIKCVKCKPEIVQ